MVANNICHNAEKVISEQNNHIKNVMVVQQEQNFKSLNDIVDNQLQQVVEKINIKKDLEKKNRDCMAKLQKRTDEVNSLLH